MKKVINTILSAAIIALLTNSAFADESKWISMFDGKTLDGWKITKENPDSFRVEDGAIVSNGPRAHLFYVGQDKPFKNFEFKAKVMTKPKANAGIYFHTKYQENGWPKYGFEAQVNATHGDPKKSGSLYAVVNVNPAPHKDNEWFDYYIKVEGKRVVIKINDKVTVDYTEPEGTKAGKDFTRVFDAGTIGLQAHDPVSKVLFKDLQIRGL
ncbi:MAG: hypothetical protein ACI9HK_001906 [Pirellulaceae bacterium]|jgi:hypothetical protein